MDTGGLKLVPIPLLLLRSTNSRCENLFRFV
jgi:hypothetical protein